MTIDNDNHRWTALRRMLNMRKHFDGPRRWNEFRFDTWMYLVMAKRDGIPTAARRLEELNRWSRLRQAIVKKLAQEGGAS